MACIIFKAAVLPRVCSSRLGRTGLLELCKHKTPRVFDFSSRLFDVNRQDWGTIAVLRRCRWLFKLKECCMCPRLLQQRQPAVIKDKQSAIWGFSLPLLPQPLTVSSSLVFFRGWGLFWTETLQLGTNQLSPAFEIPLLQSLPLYLCV